MLIWYVDVYHYESYYESYFNLFTNILFYTSWLIFHQIEFAFIYVSSTHIAW